MWRVVGVVVVKREVGAEGKEGVKMGVQYRRLKLILMV